MIGCRGWIPISTKIESDVESVHLRSTWVDHIWEGPTVGRTVPFLVNPHAPKTAGYKISKREYVTQSHIDSVMPDWAWDDPRWSDKDTWYSYFSDYIVWEWNDMDLRICDNYGYYAYNDVASFQQSDFCNNLPDMLMGIVSGYGKVQQHKRGFRSEFMSILSFFYDEDDAEHYISCSEDATPHDEYSYTTLAEFAELMSLKYNIPLVSTEEAKEIEKQYAR